MPGKDRNRKPPHCSYAGLQHSSERGYLQQDLDGQDALQTIGAAGARALPYRNTAAGKERVPSPWQDFLG